MAVVLVVVVFVAAVIIIMGCYWFWSYVVISVG